MVRIARLLVSMVMAMFFFMPAAYGQDVTIFYADFEADSSESPPNQVPPPDPPYDNIALVNVFPMLDNTLNFMEVEWIDNVTKGLAVHKEASIGDSPIFMGFVDPSGAPYDSGLYRIQWKSRSKVSNQHYGMASLRDSDPSGRYAYVINYQANGNILLQDGTGQWDTGVLYDSTTYEHFMVLVDMDNRTFQLSINGVRFQDGSPEANRQFLHSGFSDVRAFFWEIGGIDTEDYVIDDISIVKLESCASGDADSDGICDDVDNCPDNANPDQADGDGDGIGDVCDIDPDNDGVSTGDNCPTVYNPDQIDFDNDFFGDACDNCPGVVNSDQGDSDGDGIGDVCETATVPEEERPSGSGGSTDSDGDGISDAKDNCPSVANADQADGDNDGIGYACDLCPGDPSNDADGDGICAGTGFVSPKAGDQDNCPNVGNANQTNLDGDSTGDACDSDADGDTVLSIAFGGTDCNDLDYFVSPQVPEIPGNGKDDDCNPATPDKTYDIVFEPAGFSYDAWLPTGTPAAPGPAIAVTARVVGQNVDPSTTITFTLPAEGVTHYLGGYTNDADTDSGADIVWSSNGNTLNFIPKDFGGSITIHAEATIQGYGIVKNDFTLPKDTDRDGLPDAWENLYGNLDRNGDIDTGEGNPYTGDGLTNFEEYRGFMWKQLVDVSSDQRFKTSAYVPKDTVEHFRTNPRRKDLFVEFTGFDTYNGSLPLTALHYPFALGKAFFNAGIDVHAVEDILADALGVQNIHVLRVTNDRVNPYPFTDGHINKRGIRDWSWDTKGSSGLGDALVYGSYTTAFQLSLDGYFNDRPYEEKIPGVAGFLDPISSVEDKNDNGSDDRIKGANESGANGILDGDTVAIGVYNKTLTAFDIDNDGMVELPVAGNVVDANHEYTRAQVLKHTITHEMGHAVGMPHNSNSSCLMYEYSNDWSRDDSFSATAKAVAQIHN